MKSNRKQITADQAIKIVSQYACPGDYNCETWDEVRSQGIMHIDGLAAALEIDNDYEIIEQ